MYRLSQKTIKFGGLSLLALAFLTQCSSAPDSDSPRRAGPQQPVLAEPADTSDGERSAAAWLAQAESAAQPMQQLQALVQAALAFQRQQQWQRSAALLATIESQRLTPSLHAFYQLARAQWLAQQHQWQAASETLQPVVRQFQQRTDRVHALQQLAYYYGQQQQFWSATQLATEAQQYLSSATPEQQAQAVWHYARYTPAQQLPSQRPSDFQLAGWWRLLQTLHNNPVTGSQLTNALQRWQASYSKHSANSLVAQWRQQQWSSVTEVAVLLPLSGRYAPQGQALRDGLLAAASQQQLTLTFYDTAQLSVAEQQQEILANDIQHIVGPLLKENVSHWLDQPLVGPQQLLLNTAPASDQAVVTQDLVQFALAPEQEATQAADYIYRGSQRTPLVIAADSSSNQRQAATFMQRWQSLSDKTPEQGTYQDRDGMQEVVENKLGVTASKRRINEVKIAAGKIIVDEQERSRADVDSIFLPGNLQHVRLLKPFIDVNLSPFAPRLQVYANSAIHGRANHQGDSDLAGIRFSETPALLADNDRYELVASWLQLRSNASLADARLFAMGADSLPLLQRLDVLKRMPGIIVKGYSGDLAVTMNQVQRRLDWAEFQRNGIERLSSQ